MEYYAVSRVNAVTIRELDEKQLDLFLVRMRNTNWGSHKFVLGSIEIVNDWTELQEAVDAFWWYKNGGCAVHIRIVPASLLEVDPVPTPITYTDFMNKLESHVFPSYHPTESECDAAFEDFIDCCRTALNCCVFVADNVRHYHPAKKTPRRIETKEDLIYELTVKALIEQRAEAVAEGAKKHLYTAPEIVSLLKKSDDFKKKFDDGVLPPDDTIEKGIYRTEAWKNRKKTLVDARNDVGFGETYYDQKKNDRHWGRTGSSMEPFRDVNNEGDGDDG